jgi:hypothetical protein
MRSRDSISLAGRILGVLLLVFAATAQATTKSDSGVGTDANPVAGNWVTGTSNGIRRLSNQFQASASEQYCVSFWSTSEYAFQPNQRVGVVINSPGGDDNGGVVARWATTGGGRGYSLEYRHADARLYLSKFTAGVPSVLAAPVVSSISSPTLIEMELTDDGADVDIELFIGGVSQGITTDSSSPFATGQPGMYYRADNANATKLTNWGASDASSSGGLLLRRRR